MFFDTKLNNHNLKYHPFKSCIVPRPIGWISTISKENIVNLAPYSYFNAVADIPPVVMFASASHQDGSNKDSLRNIEDTRQFVVNIASFNLREKVNLSSKDLPFNLSEAEQFSITMTESTKVSPPRVKEALISLECEYINTFQIDIEGKPISSKIVLGQVVGIYIDDTIIYDGKIDITKLEPIARLGYNEYAVIKEIFKMNRP